VKFLVPNYSCLQNPSLGGRGLPPQDPRSLSSVLNWICWTPPEQNSWVRHCLEHIHNFNHWLFLKQMKNNWWCVYAVLLLLPAWLFTPVLTTSDWSGHQYACGFKPGVHKTAALHSMFIAMSALHISYCGLHYYDTMLQSSQQAPTLQRNYYLQTAALYRNPTTVLIFNLNLDDCNNSVNPKHWENHRYVFLLPTLTSPFQLHK